MSWIDDAANQGNIKKEEIMRRAQYLNHARSRLRGLRAELARTENPAEARNIEREITRFGFVIRQCIAAIRDHNDTSINFAVEGKRNGNQGISPDTAERIFLAKWKRIRGDFTQAYAAYWQAYDMAYNRWLDSNGADIALEFDTMDRSHYHG